MTIALDPVESGLRLIAAAEATSQSIELKADNEKAYGEDPGSASSGAVWGRFTVVWSTANQVDMATNRRERNLGMVIVQLFSPVGRGTGALVRASDGFAQAFRTATLTGTVFRAPYAQRVGPDGRGWFQRNVVAPFQYDALLT